MNRSHVTLPQILVAASTRHANMVSESAGYLVLALCEAIGCLPLAVPDNFIELTAEGAVSVAQQGKVLQAPEASQAMRDLFARLLAVTTGATPRLAAVARARDLSAERGVDAFAAEIEAALVPMNRAAGKRSLGRLARETLRAIESGSLALHLQARAAVAAKEAPAAVTAVVAPLIVAPPAPTAAVAPLIVAPPAPTAAVAPLIVAPPPPKPVPLRVPIPIPMPPMAITPPPSMLGLDSISTPLGIPVTPTTPGLALDTVATEAPVDSGVFGAGATPTCQDAGSIAVEPASAPDANVSPPVDSTNSNNVLCEPTQLSAREVRIDPVLLRAPRFEPEAKAVSTKRLVRRIEPPRSVQEITLASAGVEPIIDAGFETPAPSAPEIEIIEVAALEFLDCHDGQTQSAPRYRETLPGLAPITPPVTPTPSTPEAPISAEPLQSSEYLLVTPSALPQDVILAIASPDESTHLPQEEVVSSQHLIEEAISSQHVVEEAISSQHAVEEAISSQHAVEEAISSQHAVEETVASQHVVEEAISSQHVVEEAVASQHVVEEAVASQHVVEEAVSSQRFMEFDAVALLSQLLNEEQALSSQHPVEEAVASQHAVEEAVSSQRFMEFDAEALFSQLLNEEQALSSQHVVEEALASQHVVEEAIASQHSDEFEAEALFSQLSSEEQAVSSHHSSEEEVLSSRHLMTEPPSEVAVAEEAAKTDANESLPVQPIEALDLPSNDPGRVDELLSTFGQPEEGEEAMLRKTASCLKELAGLDPTPCAPSVSPAIRVPVMTKLSTPAWLPEDPRQAPVLEPAPLVRASRSWRAKLMMPFTLFIALTAGFAVVHWRLPEVVLRWVHPIAAKQPASPPQAAVEQDVYVEP